MVPELKNQGIELIILDFDGVIADANEAHARVTIRSLKEAGFNANIEKQDVFRHFGKKYKDVLKSVLGEYDQEKLEKAMQKQQELLHSDWFFEQVKLLPRVKETIENLKEEYFIAIATGNDRKFLDHAIEKFQLQGLFDHTLTSSEVENSKPSPEILHKALAHFGLDSKKAIFVGDSPSDVEAAEKADMVSVAVLTGIMDQKQAEKADFILNGLYELPDLLK